MFRKQSESLRTFGPRSALNAPGGFSLIELVITVAVLAILTLGVIPLIQVSIKRQKEEQLRAALREMREAIDQFHREALVGASLQAQGQGTTAQQEQAGRPPQAQAQQMLFSDPRVRVFITDQTIFTAENPDRFPPDLELWSREWMCCRLQPEDWAGGVTRTTRRPKRPPRIPRSRKPKSICAKFPSIR